MSQPSYQYSPLQHADDIRLVCLHPEDTSPPASNASNSSISDSGHRKILIDIKVARLEQCHYSALSYCWGKPDGAETLQVRHNGASSTLSITPNLHTVLQRLQKSESRILWIDQLCINQEDNDERSRQVRRMSDIYANASNVIIWLGEADEDSDRAMRFIPEISVRNLDRLARREDTRDAWAALANLMRRQWFTRRWIIQEVAFAQKADLWCGSLTVPWRQFAEAVTLFESRIDDINPLFRERRMETISSRESKFRKIAKYAVPAAGLAAGMAVAVLSRGAIKPKPWMGPVASNWANNFGHDMDRNYRWTTDEYPIGQVRNVGAHSLVAALDQIIRKQPGNQKPERLCTIETLLSYLPTFECEMPHDVVFAITSLAKDNHLAPPNYNDSPALVCQNIVESTVTATGSLNIICRPWAPVLPSSSSWLPQQLTKFPFQRESRGYTRRAADILVGHPGRCPYKASGPERASVRFDTMDGKSVLVAKGFRVGGRYELLDPVTDGVIPSSWFRRVCRGPRGSKDNETRKEIYWRTLVCDKDEQGGPALSWMRRACEELYANSKDDSLDTEQLLHASFSPASKEDDDEHTLSSLMKVFLKRVQAATWNRRMIRFETEGLGVLPEEAAVGDEICILFGCDVPVVLRQHADGVWELVGETYVYGIMNGEALDHPYQEETFCLE